MLNNISWQSYVSALAILLVLYYFWVLVYYYGSEFKLLWKRKAAFLSVSPSNHGNECQEGLPVNYQQTVLFNSPVKQAQAGDQPEEEHLPVVQAAVDELQAYFDQAAQVDAGREQVLNALQHILKKYPLLKGSSYQTSLNHLLAFHCENQCSIHLSAEAVMQLWNG